MMRARKIALVASTLATALALTGCSLAGDDTAADESSPQETGATAGGEVVLQTHGSFSLPDDLVAAWEEETGYELTVRSGGDAGVLASKISLTAGNPTGDAVYGIDNTFASRPVEAGALAPYEPSSAPPEEYDLDEGADVLTPVDTANVCVNVDTAWFEDKGQQPPAVLEDLTDPAYKGMFVVPAASSSSPGMAFFLATLAAFGDEGWKDYWTDLLANDTKIVKGWEDAYFTDFTGGGNKSARRPIVVSYDSSPAFTVKGGRTTTAALLDTCFRQVEYAGVLAGAKNPAGAEALIDWLVSDEVQAALPESMYVFPVSPSAELPEDWARFARQPETPYEVSAADIEANRDAWLTEWTDVTTR
jgi:thiamine transport system substrate-binding protein